MSKLATELKHWQESKEAGAAAQTADRKDGKRKGNTSEESTTASEGNKRVKPVPVEPEKRGNSGATGQSPEKKKTRHGKAQGSDQEDCVCISF